MYSIGDAVMHPSEGVCTVADIRSMQFSGSLKRDYYVLIPSTEKSSSTVYLPVERGNSILRRLLSRADILSLIRESTLIDFDWITDSKQRKDAFYRLIHSGDIARVIRMICEIYAHNAQRIAEGKKPCASDESILAEAQRLVHQEFSYVLRLSAEDTVTFIQSELNK
ncbi:MAG: hypothetical protein IKU34_11495 [Clostridia bacterium]|nr:hypothetical protein [Clostridia bacterium]